MRPSVDLAFNFDIDFLCIIQRKIINKRSRSLWNSIAYPKPITEALSLSPVILQPMLMRDLLS